jgi:glucitol operon activator protein
MTYLTKLLLVIAAMWASQLAMAYLQAKRFQSDLRALRAKGVTAVGMGGRRYRGGRAFVALAVNESGVVVDGLVLRGLSVFANSKPLTTYTGFSLEEIISGKPEVQSNPRKISEAAKQSAEHIRDYFARVDSGE